MPRTDPSERAAEAIVQRLRTSQALEVESADAYPALQQELRAVFEQAEWTEREADELREALTEALESSEHVEELYVDDEMLARYLSAALLDYFAVVGKHRGPGASRRTPPKSSTREESAPPPAPAAETSTASFAEQGYVFPLFSGAPNDADLDEGGPCSVCKAQVPFRFEGACFSCLRSGRAHVTHDTEFGRVSEIEAAEGMTAGTDEELDPRGTQPITGDDGTRYRVAKAQLNELLRTPQYRTNQGESWLFHCALPMVFLGRSAVDDITPDQVPDLLAPATVPDVDEFLEAVLDDKQQLYVFRCQSCGTLRGHHES